MKSALRLALATAAIYLSFISSAAAYYCFQPSDIGYTTHQVQRVVTLEDTRDYITLEVQVVSLRCVESYGQYRWEPTFPLDTYTRRAVDGSLYTTKVLGAESIIATETYGVIESQAIRNHQFQSFIFKLSARDLFKDTRFVRLRYFQRFSVEIDHGGKIIHPTPSTGVETIIDLRR